MTTMHAKPFINSIKENLKSQMEKIIKKTKKIPSLVLFSFQNSKETDWYFKSISKTCANFPVKKLLIEKIEPAKKENIKISLKALKEKLNHYNSNPNIQGILLGQPLPKEYQKISDHITPNKDIEGITTSNLGKLFVGKTIFAPCTALSVIELLKQYKINLTGKNICILGRSNIVGKPLALLLSNQNATITLCHSKTTNIKQHSKSSDIVISAVGKAKFITSEYIKKDSIVIDIGTSVVNNKLIGDIDFDSVSKLASKISPVPGGVGTLTNLMLIKNLIKALEINI